MMVTFAHLRISNNDLTEASSGGNKILSSQDSGRDTHHMDAESCQGLLSLIKKEMKPSTRHLRGKWFSFFSREIELYSYPEFHDFFKKVHTTTGII